MQRDSEEENLENESESKKPRTTESINGLAVNEETDCDYAWDDVKDEWLDPECVKAARAEEMEFLKKEQLYVKVPLEDCFATTGKPPTGVRWIDTNKGSGEKPNYRSRLVAKDFRGNEPDREDLFAAIPPLEAKKILFAQSAIR